MMNTLQELRILQYNVHKSKNKMMIILLHEKTEELEITIS